MTGPPFVRGRMGADSRWDPVARTGHLTVDARGRVLGADPWARAILGWGDGEFPPRLDALPATDPAGFARAVEAVRATGRPERLRDALRLPAGKGGEERTADVEVAPFGDRRGRARELLLSVHEPPEGLDVVELSRQAFLHSHDAIEITDASGAYVDVNPAYERIYGYRRAEVLGKRSSILRSPKMGPDVFRTLWQDIQDPRKGRWAGEILNIGRDGREHPVRLTVDAIRDRSGRITHFIGVATDLSEQRNAELAAIHSERLASVGQLAAGVAHEINTPLSNVLLIADSLKRRAPTPWVAARADAIVGQVEIAGRIVSGLLDFSRSHPPELARIDLIGAAEEAIEFVRGKRSPDVEITELREAPALPIAGNRVQLSQVFSNLLNNAYDAMHDRGRVTIRYRILDGRAAVSVEDTGPGIPPEALPRVFEPFFTTKPVGQGTGLGLSICLGIVQSHRGELKVDSTPGRGAVFTVVIPLAPDDPPTAPGAAPPARPGDGPEPRSKAPGS